MSLSPDERRLMLARKLGDEIRKSRKAQNLRQADLAERISITESQIGRIERGDALPSLTTLEEIHEVLGLDLQGIIS